MDKASITNEQIAYFIHLMNEKNLELHSVTILQNGKKVFSKGFFPFSPTEPHAVFSCSKSFISAAIGLLWDQGIIRLDAPIIEYFPQYQHLAHKPAAQTTVHELLTMAMGENAEPYLEPDSDWVPRLLSKPLSWPNGTKYFYASMCTYLLSAIITQLTGSTACDFLRKNIFSKLGIKNCYWEEDRYGRNTGGWGLHISTEDMAKFGQFILNKGKINDEQILSVQWIDMATSLQIETATVYPASRIENCQGYGYQFWLCTHDAFRASGLYGQLCMIQPKNQLVLSVTSSAGGSQAILDCFFEALDTQTIPKTMCNFPVFEITPAATTFLTKPIELLQEKLRKQTLSFKANEACLDSIYLDFFMKDSKKILKLCLTRHKETFTLLAGENIWHSFFENFHRFSPYDRLEYATDQVSGFTSGIGYASYGWLDECTLQIRMRHSDQAARYQIMIYFDAEYLTFEYQVTEMQSHFTFAHAVAKLPA